MPESHRFKDEWLAKVIAAIPSVPKDFVEQSRKSHEASLAHAALAAAVLSHQDLGKAVERETGISPIDLEAEAVDKALLRLVPEKLCRRHKLVPVQLIEDAVELAMAYPADLEASEDVRSVTGRDVRPRFCLLEQVEDLISHLYNPQGIIFDLLKRVENEGDVSLVDDNRVPEAAIDPVAAARPPIIRLVNSIIGKAVRMGASDIHIEQEEKATLVRFRIDGILKQIMSMPKYVGAGPVVSRLKIMANLDLADRLRPQDGRAKIRTLDREFGLRISTLPTGMGEKAVIRLLDPRSANVPLAELGFGRAIVNRLEALFRSEKGMVLVTGPTGSGKTTTLYAALSLRKGEDVNITTVEDPIEYRLEGINQVQVNEKQGLTFSVVLRSVLRQDPDVVMLGEIRDPETADVAFQAALTGHMVLSTLHTNDVFATISRLRDLGVQGFKLAPALAAVTAQRLVRRLCGKCRRQLPESSLDPVLKRALSLHELELQAFGPKGCADCGYSGYRGRLCIIELLEVGAGLKRQLSTDKDEGALRRAATAEGSHHSMTLDALEHVSRGETSWEEVLPHLERELGVGRNDQPYGPATAPSKRVLVADPDAGARIILRSLLQKRGFSVEEAADGLEALQKTADHAPDLLVLAEDITGLDAAAVVENMRSGLGLVDLPIVSISRAGEPRAGGLPLAAESVTKPITPAAVERIEAVLRREGGWADAAEVMSPRIPIDEARRMAALTALNLLDTPPEERFDRITRMVQQAFGVSMATLTLVDAERQWFKSKQGLAASQTPREISFCGHAINEKDAMVVEDAYLDPRFSQNPLVAGEPGVRFYAGQPLRAPDGSKVGVLCAIDTKPRSFSAADRERLRELAAQIEAEWAAGPGGASGPS